MKKFSFSVCKVLVFTSGLDIIGFIDLCMIFCYHYFTSTPLFIVCGNNFLFLIFVGMFCHFLSFENTDIDSWVYNVQD